MEGMKFLRDLKVKKVNEAEAMEKQLEDLR
jgi:hypothetical protein